ncbi:MAG: LptF/LptG family permease [Candidatus Oxydemutatoraceae bacterium WSBS_2016_MAG_OTU14]
MKVLNKYFYTQMTYGSLIVLSVLLGLFMLFELIHQLSGIGLERSIFDALLFTLLEMPADMAEALPIAVTGGSAMVLGTMAANSELAVFRTLGYSRKRLLCYLIGPSFIFVAVMFALNDGLIPLAEGYVQTLKAKSVSNLHSVKSNLWLRERNKFIYIAYILDKRYYDVIIYEYNNDHTQLETITLADVMEIDDAQMKLSGVRIAQLNHNQLDFTEVENKLVKRDEDAGEVSFQVPHPNTLNSWQLYTQITALDKNSLDSRFHELELWKRLAEPLSIIVLLFVVAPFCFAVRRESNAWLFMLIGLSIGLAYLLIDRIVNAWLLIYQYPPAVAGFAGVFVFTLLGIANHYFHNRMR